MTVWIINPFDNLPQEGNRPQRYWLMARAWVRAGHRVTLWTSDFSHATKSRRRLNPGFAADPEIEVVQIPTPPYPTNVGFARIRNHCELARGFGRLAEARLKTAKVDLVIASTPPLGLAAAALRVAKRYGARFVCDIQDAWPETFERLLPRGFKWTGGLLFAPMRHTARRLYREADLVTGVSRRYAELSGRSDFYLAYHGIESDPAAPVPADATDPLRNRRWVYAGNLGVGYDLATVVTAVAKRFDLTLDIAGSGPTEARLRAQVAALGLSERVRFHGYLNAADLSSLLAHCGVGLIPMRDDSWVGLPYKLGDYLKAGLRVLSSLHGECGELLERTGYGRTYALGDPDSLLNALATLPATAVALPEELRAERIYPDYVARLGGLIE